MPLQIAYAVTIHRCQGLEAGPDAGDRWRRMIIDPGDILWEISMCLGTQYVATSRAKTLGSKYEKYPEDSSLYWTGTNVSIERIYNCKRKRNNQICLCFKKREKWLQHLEERAKATREKYNTATMDHIIATTYAKAISGQLIEDKTDLANKIANMIHKPNQTWKEASERYRTPKTFFTS